MKSPGRYVSASHRQLQIRFHVAIYMEACYCLRCSVQRSSLMDSSSSHSYSDVLVRLPRDSNELSIKQLHDIYGEPDLAPVTRCDGGLLPPNVPVMPFHLGKDADHFTPADVRVLLGDLGESFAPASDIRHARNCHIPIRNATPRKSIPLRARVSELAVSFYYCTTTSLHPVHHHVLPSTLAVQPVAGRLL